MKVVGIDIGTSSIKVVEAQSSSKGVSILSFREHPLGHNPAHDADIEIIEFLQALSLQYDLSQTKVVFGLRQERVSLRLKMFPFTDRLKILKSLPFELEEDLPFNSDTAIFEARAIRYLGNQAEVLAMATPKHRIAEFLGKFQGSGLPISILSSEGIAFSNCFERWAEPVAQFAGSSESLEEEAKPSRNLSLVIQLGHTHTLVSAFEETRLVAVRSILWGGKNIAEAIARKYEIPYIEALREMRTKAFILPNKEGASYDQIVFSDTISNQFRELGNELKLSVLEIETELNGKIHSAEMTGGLSGVLHLAPFLTQLLEVPVNRASILGPFWTNFEKTPAVENSIGTALGLALEGLRRPRNPPVQFLRAEFAAQNESLQVLWRTWGKTAQVMLGLFVIFAIYSVVRESLSYSLLDQTQNVLKDQAKAVAKLPTKQANEAGVKKYIREKRKRAQDLKSLEGLAKMNSALEIVKRISEAAPARTGANLNITSLHIEDQKVAISGTAQTTQDSSALQQSLNKISKEGRVSASPGQPMGAQGVSFGFSLNVDRGTETR